MRDLSVTQAAGDYFAKVYYLQASVPLLVYVIAGIMGLGTYTKWKTAIVCVVLVGCAMAVSGEMQHLWLRFWVWLLMCKVVSLQGR